MNILIDEGKCTGCGECADVCPAEPNVFEIVAEKAKRVHPEECIDCGACEDACPEEAINLEDD
jgi:NAD-dependent dihydropyrimidine dehydrogenase PreA subunit